MGGEWHVLREENCYWVKGYTVLPLYLGSFNYRLFIPERNAAVSASLAVAGCAIGMRCTVQMRH